MKKINQTSKANKRQKAESVFKESHVMVILEDMRDSIKLVAEGQIGLERQMNVRFEQVDARFDQMDARFGQMDREFAQVKANQKITLEHLFNVDERFETLEKEVQEIKLELVRLSKKTLSPEETKSFSKRIFTIEKDMEKFRVFMQVNSKLKVA